MNGLESAYLHGELVPMYSDCPIMKRGRVWYEAVTFRLADRTTYTPDFMVFNPASNEIEFHEVKGFMYDDAWVKLKVAADMYPEFRWFLATRARKKDGGTWTIKQIGE